MLAENNVNDCFPTEQAPALHAGAAEMAIRLMAKRRPSRFPPCTKRADDGIFRPEAAGPGTNFNTRNQRGNQAPWGNPL